MQLTTGACLTLSALRPPCECMQWCATSLQQCKPYLHVAAAQH